MMGNGLQCTSYLNAREQIGRLVRHYILTHTVIVKKSTYDNEYRCRVYVFLNDEDKNLDDWNYKGTLGFWGSYIGQIVKDGQSAASYLFKWRG